MSICSLILRVFYLFILIFLRVFIFRKLETLLINKGFYFYEQALTKMQLKLVVGETEVREASRLMAVATQQAATDPRTGLIDMDTINTGHRYCLFQQ